MATTTLKFYRKLDHEMIDLFLKIMVDQMCYVSLSPSWDITFYVVMRNHAWFEMIRCCRNDGHITNACTDERIRLVLQIECTHMIFKFCSSTFEICFQTCLFGALPKCSVNYFWEHALSQQLWIFRDTYLRLTLATTWLTKPYHDLSCEFLLFNKRILIFV